jgi:hypothetical protein
MPRQLLYCHMSHVSILELSSTSSKTIQECSSGRLLGDASQAFLSMWLYALLCSWYEMGM